MTLLLISFVAGVLTVLAPCVLPLLPVIIGGSVSDDRSRFKPYVITGSLAVSVVLFTLLLRASTALIDIPQGFWTSVSGIIILIFAMTMIFPGPWEKLSAKLHLGKSGNKLLAQGSKKGGLVGDVVMGFALGPVFSSCSPTYFVILATVLPASFLLGTAYLIAYAIGLSGILLLIALLGQRFVSKLGVLSDPRGWFKKGVGILFLLVGIAIMTGFDKTIEACLVDRGLDFTGIERILLEETDL